MTTGNSDMADKTGNSYTTGTTTNSVEITTASQVFLTTVSSNKVPPSVCDNVRQPEMKTYKRFGPELAISGSRSLSKSFGYTFMELVIIENPDFVVGI